MHAMGPPPGAILQASLNPDLKIRQACAHSAAHSATAIPPIRKARDAIMRGGIPLRATAMDRRFAIIKGCPKRVRKKEREKKHRKKNEGEREKSYNKKMDKKGFVDNVIIKVS